MAVRSTMVNLLLCVRDLIGDNPDDVTARVWTDQQLQDALDRDRDEFKINDFRELHARYATPVGIYTWTDYYDPWGWGDWESDATLWNGAFTQVTPSTSDLLTGHWTFSAGQPPPVFVVGQTYDVSAAARAIALRWLAKEALSFDFSAMRGTSFTVSQKRAGLQQLADNLAVEMRVRTAKLIRTDVTSALY
jgi:hypothetical protein